MLSGFQVFQAFRAVRVFASRTALIVHILYHSKELEKLKKWAKRKQLQGVFAHYSWLHRVFSTQLVIYKTYTPISYELACFLHTLKNQIVPRPALYSKGAAAKYRLRK